MEDQSVTQTLESSTRVRASFKLLNASQVKRFALDFAKANRTQKFTRVSEDFLIACEANLKQFIQGRVKSHPSVGQTLR